MRRLFAPVPLAALVACLLSGGPARAQDPVAGPVEVTAVARSLGPFSLLRLAPELEARLALTGDQKAALDGVRARLQEEVRSLAQPVAPGGDRRETWRTLQTATERAEEAAVAVLTSNQRMRYESWQEDGTRYEGLGRSVLPLLLVDGLTDEQKARLKKLSEGMLARRLAALKGFGPGSDRDAALQKLQALERETRSAVRKVLTDEQDRQYDASAGGGRQR